MTAAVTIRLSPSLSCRVVLRVDEYARAMGWTAAKLTVEANAKARLAGETPFTENLLDVWRSKARLKRTQRLELDKALALLAVLGCGSNRLDALVAELGDEIATLIDEAVSDAV